MDKLKVEIVVPDWTNWIATDKNGDVYAYKDEPKCMPSKGFWTNGGEMTNLCRQVPPKNWKQELYEWK